MRLASDGTHKSPSGNQGPIHDAQGKDRESPRRRPINDSGALLRIELRSVTGAEERFRVSLPHRHGAPLMCTDRRVRHDTVGRKFDGVCAELSRVEPDEGYLIEKRSVPDCFGFRIHGERELLRTAERKIIGLDHLSRSVTEREYKSIAALRSSNFWIVGGSDRESSEDETESQCCFQQGPSACRRRSGRSRNLVGA